MLTTVVSVVSLLCALFTGLLLRWRRLLLGVPSWVVIPAVLIAVIGVLLISGSSERISYFSEVRNWPQSEAVVVQSYVSEDRNLDPQVVFSYSVDGKQYTDTSSVRAPGFGGKRKRFDAAEYLVEKYSPGTAMSVHYNPDDPAYCETVTHPEWHVYMKLGFGATLIIVGGILLILGMSRPSA